MNTHVPPASPACDALAINGGGWLSDLALAYAQAGDALAVKGHVAAALEKYQAGLGIFERLVAKYPGNVSIATALRELKERNDELKRRQPGGSG
jgi:hypothetical protein